VAVNRSAAIERNQKGNKVRFRYVEVKTLSDIAELFRNYQMEKRICKYCK